jgi:hypothetical protein
VTEYRLYVESGPKMKTTMVHVPELLGCIANAGTTEAALEATPGEIRRFLGFLRRHGEDVDPEADFTVVIAQHVMEGSWIGCGDPAPGFETDFAPLSREDEDTYRNRFRALGSELIALIGNLPAEEVASMPAKERALRDIVLHIANAEPEYFRASNIGKPDGTKETLRAVEEAAPEGLPDAIADLWSLLGAQLDRITTEVREGQVRRGEKLWTARRGFRRLLEHPWEHLREMERRLESTTGGTRTT